MTVSGVSSSVLPLIQSALDINKQLDDLNRQLGTGIKSDSYAGLGGQGGIAIALNAQLAALDSYDNTISNVGATLGIQQQVLQQIGTIGTSVQQAASQPNYTLGNSGQTATQNTAVDQLDQLVGLLNTQGANGYLFSGLGFNQTAVDTTDHILNGNGAAAGLKQLIAQRLQADQGADGLCRLVIPAPGGTTVSVSEDVANSPFGLKLASVSSTLTGATVAGPTGSPPGITVNLGATNPNDGETVTFNFNLPDGTTQSVQLQATTSVTPKAGQFMIGGTTALTAANLQTALAAAVTQIGVTTMPAASAVAASNNFFDDPPMRVNGTLTSNNQTNYTADESGAGNLTINDGNGHTAAVTFAATDNTLAKKIIAINAALTTAGSTVSATQDASGNLEFVNASGMQVDLTGSTGTVAADLGFGAGNATANGAWAATKLVAGTPANTVFWYTGDNSAASARSTATARVDANTTISYGTQANEQGIRMIVQNVATLAATTYSASDPNAQASYLALNNRIYSGLGPTPGIQNITDIETSLTNSQATVNSLQDQHQQTSAMLNNMLQSIQGVNPTQVGAEILALQTRLSASLSATARLSQLTLVSYLSPVNG
ncbi:MAG TPA: flagellar protein [Pseudolabrys sp.]|nr:flagellar protein [Pseudolabrys sp.]